MEQKHLRELHHDFRRYYGVRYEDIDPDEAIDLIYTLPHGSLLVSALYPEHSWTPEREAIADLQDTIYDAHFGPLTYRVTRPQDIVARNKAKAKAKQTKKKIETTQWEEV